MWEWECVAGRSYVKDRRQELVNAKPVKLDIIIYTSAWILALSLIWSSFKLQVLVSSTIIYTQRCDFLVFKELNLLDTQH